MEALIPVAIIIGCVILGLGIIWGIVVLIAASQARKTFNKLTERASASSVSFGTRF